MRHVENSLAKFPAIELFRTLAGYNFDRGLWDELKSPAYAGAVSKLKSSSRTFEYSDAEINHTVDIKAYIVHSAGRATALPAILNHR